MGTITDAEPGAAARTAEAATARIQQGDSNSRTGSLGSSIQPISFGTPDRRLFGIFHPAASALAGVVLCNAFGQEAIRAHRMLRVLAERLARAGHPVMRFDYYGTGDSMGDDLDGDLDGWATDLLEADRELRYVSGATTTVWVTMRLGAAVALRAAELAPVGLVKLVMWDPVIDGTRYLKNLRACHTAGLERAFSPLPIPAQSRHGLDPASACNEVVGFALSPLLREQIAALSLGEHRWPARPASIVVLTDPDDADGGDRAAACEREPGRVETVVVRHGTDWATDVAGDSALVPAPALMQLMRAAGNPT